MSFDANRYRILGSSGVQLTLSYILNKAKEQQTIKCKLWHLGEEINLLARVGFKLVNFWRNSKTCLVMNIIFSRKGFAIPVILVGTDRCYW